MDCQLPARVRKLFWDYPGTRLRWEDDRDLITARVLSAGDWGEVCWLRRQVGDSGLAAWLRTRRGRGLDPRRLRFWQLVLDLPAREVNGWIAGWRQNPWSRRTA